MDYSTLRKRILSAEQYKKDTVQKLMDQNLEWYQGNYNNNSSVKYALNMAYMIAQVITTSLYSQDPAFAFQILGDVESVLSDLVGFKVVLDIDRLETCLEKVVKIYFKEMRSRATNKRAITDATWAGFGVTKMGYSFDVDKTVAEIKQSNPEDFATLAESMDFSEIVRKDEPFKVRVNPLDIILPTTATSLYELPWVCQVIYMEKSAAKDLYGIVLPTTAHEREADQSIEYVKLYEYHSLDSQDPTIYTLCEGYNKFVQEAKHPLLSEDGKRVKNLFQFIWFNDSNDSVYPMPDISLVADQIREINIAVTRRVNLIKRQRAIFKATGSWDLKALNKLETGDDAAIMTNVSPDGTLEQLPLLTLGQEFYENINSMKSEVFETLGLTDYAMGGATQKRKATEAQLMEKSRIDRVQNRVNSIEEFVFEQADCLVEIMKAYKITNRTFNIAFTKEDIQKFDFNGMLLKSTDAQIQVVPGSTVLMDKDMELRRITQLANIAVQLAPSGVVNVMELWKEILRKSGFSNDVDRFVQSSTKMPQEASQPGAIPQLPPSKGTPSPTPMSMGSNPAQEQGL